MTLKLICCNKKKNYCSGSYVKVEKNRFKSLFSMLPIYITLLRRQKRFSLFTTFHRQIILIITSKCKSTLRSKYKIKLCEFRYWRIWFRSIFLTSNKKSRKFRLIWNSNFTWMVLHFDYFRLCDTLLNRKTTLCWWSLTEHRCGGVPVENQTLGYSNPSKGWRRRRWRRQW